jgi:hypothetical protein
VHVVQHPVRTKTAGDMPAVHSGVISAKGIAAMVQHHLEKNENNSTDYI